MIPTQRSVIARLRYRSLDGGWSEVSLCRATRIRVFPRNAVMERKIFMAERKISSLSTPLINSAEQNSSMNVFWFSSSVTFVWAILICDEMRCKWGLWYDSHKFITINLRLFISLLDSLSVPYFSVIDETRFPVYVRALSCHLRIALLDWVESDIDVDSHNHHFHYAK